MTGQVVSSLKRILKMTQKAYSQGTAFPPTKPGVLRIYSMRFCPFALRTRLVLAHKNIPHETVNINLKSKPDWFLALNPLGQVPVLQIDDQVLPESTATCDWLDEVYPENRLKPDNPYRRAWDRVLLEYLGKLGSTLMVVAKAESDDLQEKLLDLEKHLKFYEEKISARGGGAFFGGTSPAMIDFLLWPYLERLPKLAVMKANPAVDIDPKKFPKMASWVKAMWEVPAVKATTFDTDTHVKYMRGSLNGTPNYDFGLEE